MNIVIFVTLNVVVIILLLLTIVKYDVDSVANPRQCIYQIQAFCMVALLLSMANFALCSHIFINEYDRGQKDALNGKQKFQKVMIEQIQVIEKKKKKE